MLEIKYKKLKLLINFLASATYNISRYKKIKLLGGFIYEKFKK